MGTEIERTFLVAGDDWRERTRGEPAEIVQGYLHADDDSSVRVRLVDGEHAVLTVKRGGAGIQRSEVEVPIEVASARRLLEEAVVGELVRKRRHRVDLGGEHDLVAEVDEFTGAHEGLVLAEVELPSTDTPVPQVAWLGEEVTDDPRYYNASLAREGLPGQR